MEYSTIAEVAYSFTQLVVAFVLFRDTRWDAAIGVTGWVGVNGCQGVSISINRSDWNWHQSLDTEACGKKRTVNQILKGVVSVLETGCP